MSTEDESSCSIRKQLLKFRSKFLGLRENHSKENLGIHFDSSNLSLVMPPLSENGQDAKETL